MMKIKDIEKNLKEEHNNTVVPDVYERVSKAPLNKLLSGETPARAFQKQLIMRLLVFVFVIFTVAAIGLSAMWLSPSNAAAEPDCYIAVTVSSDDGDSRIGIVMSGGKNFLVMVEEERSGVYSDCPVVSYTSIISDFIEPKQGDKVSIELIGAVGTVNDSSRAVVEEIEILYNGITFEMTVRSGDRMRLAAYLTEHGAVIPDNAASNDLIKIYTELFS